MPKTEDPIIAPIDAMNQLLERLNAGYVIHPGENNDLVSQFLMANLRALECIVERLPDAKD